MVFLHIQRYTAAEGVDIIRGCEKSIAVGIGTYLYIPLGTSRYMQAHEKVATNNNNTGDDSRW